jgi:hypothetical protein
MKLHKLIMISIIALFPSVTSAGVGAGHVWGDITNITSTSGGILVRIGSNEVPQNCTSGYVWMQIPEANKSMISLTITAWTLGRGVVIYTAPTSSGYCRIIQVDPAES